ncbi:MAG: hypothetical protein ACFFKA_14040 [Candidatus Thorarchaeota archaeon]
MTRALGPPEKVSKIFSEYFSNVTENLVLQGLIDLSSLKQILDAKYIYWAGIKENFQTIQEDEILIGKLAWRTFKDYSGIDPLEEVKSLLYNRDIAPWGFSLMACVLYK